LSYTREMGNDSTRRGRTQPAPRGTRLPLWGAGPLPLAGPCRASEPSFFAVRRCSPGGLAAS